MQISKTRVKLIDIFNGYADKGEDGVFAYDNGMHRLTVRPSYQREFVYTLDKQKAVIESILKGYPINIMYWAVNSDNDFELLDGQQRTLSICEYMAGHFTVETTKGIIKGYYNLSPLEKDKFEQYELDIYQCRGSQDEKLAWFKTINIAGEVLTPQELRNATYCGTWLQDAKKYFSKPNCQALSLSNGYIKANPVRQELLEKVLKWHTDYTNMLEQSKGLQPLNIEGYMALHQMDKNANKLWLYYCDVMTWATSRFNSVDNKKLLENQDWGYLYNRYKDADYDELELKEKINSLLLDDDVTSKNGIIPYILSGGALEEERKLHLRTFPDSVKYAIWQKQGCKCPQCEREGIHKTYELSEMEADHITPWSQGGKTVASNCQMLCKLHNRSKSAK